MGNPTGDFLGGVPAACFQNQNPCGSVSVLAKDTPTAATPPSADGFDQQADDPRFDRNRRVNNQPQNS